ncbi:MAG TPA: zinc-dependent alcohol dehydrogenase family protein [Thermoanaerobaculia bacterium]|nr:zinc-dependent alcohol dehydrogenase family protein [Thermoanaerobaculia bacterium]
MRAMVLPRPRAPLALTDLPVPRPREGELLIRIEVCAVCRTDLHVVDGELPDPKLPLVIGHQIAGVVARGAGEFAEGERVGVPWLGWTDGTCRYCRSGRENLCDRARFTGYTIDGGYAEFCAADARYCFRLPDSYSAEEASPLLCAGLIGWRALRMAGDARRLGFYGFGSSAQILTQLARAEGREVYAFTRDGDTAAQQFARTMGAVWAGGSGGPSPEPLDAAILFAPIGPLVVAALRNLVKGGTVVCAGIHMSNIPSFPYSLLWEERAVRSVANLTRADGVEFLERAGTVRIRTERHPFALEQANEALAALRYGTVTGTAVLRISG